MRNRLKEFLERMRKSPRILWILLTCAMTLILFSVYWIGLLSVVGIEEWLDQRYFALMDYSAPVQPFPNLRIIQIDENASMGDGSKFNGPGGPQAWRKYHAEMLAALAAAGARVVAFDMYFPEPQAEYSSANQLFADAIRKIQSPSALKDSRTRIILGISKEGALSETLDKVLPREGKGVIDAGGLVHTFKGEAFANVLLAKSELGTSPIPSNISFKDADLQPSLALQMALAWESLEKSLPVKAMADGDNNRLRLMESGREVQRIYCNTRITNISGIVQREFTMPLHQIRLKRTPVQFESYVDAYNRRATFSRDYKDKVVLIGVQTKEEQMPGGSVSEEYRYLIHASILSQILGNVCPRYLSPFAQLGLLFLCCLIAGLARRYLTRKEIKIPVPYLDKLAVPVALLILLVIYALVVIQVYRLKHLVFTPGYDALSLICGYYICSRPLLQKVESVVSSASPGKSRRKSKKSNLRSREGRAV